MTRIIIRAVPERAGCVAYLRRHLPDAEWCFDKTHNAMDTFLAALDMAADGPAVHMEEDVILTTGFLEKLEAAVAERPAALIQFFSRRVKDRTAGSRWERKRFTNNQCFYLPAGYSRLIRDYASTWPRHDTCPDGYDILMDDWLHLRREPHWIHVPSLVDHREGRSMISRIRSTKRRSLTFGSPLP